MDQNEYLLRLRHDQWHILPPFLSCRTRCQLPCGRIQYTVGILAQDPLLLTVSYVRMAITAELTAPCYENADY